MYPPWHGSNPTSNAPGPPGGLATTSSSASFVPQMRWLPSVIPGPHQPQPQPQSSMESNIRMAARNPEPQGVSIPPSRPETVTISDSEHSDSEAENGRDTNGMGGGYASYATGAGAGREAGAQSSPSGPRQHPHPTPTTMSNPSGGTDEIDTPRRHGKRLTTKEEVSLFQICNRHAPEFGQRSNLCNWWRKVTDEFTRDQGHPYSWHSVRRKVEVVTKQRMKFLMEQREKVGGGGGAGGGGVGSEDLSNPQWRATIDAWIPTWRRWEEAEAKRIKKRDSRKSRKRKGRESDDEDADDAGAGGGEGGGTVDWKDSSSPAITGTGNGNGFTQSSMPPPPPVRLPPGFDSMFNHAPHTPTARMGYPSQYQPSSSGTVDAGVMNAMLDTLNKLNKRLDSTPPNPRASPVISALVSNADSLTQSQESASRQMEGRSGSEIAPLGSSELIGTLKEELRLEMRAELRRELEKDRAALEEKLDSVQRTQDMILEMLRQEPD